jgi:hypothetical protein
VFALDPPPGEVAVGGEGLLHLGWGEPEQRFALAAAQSRLDLRATVARVYRALREAGAVECASLDALLGGVGVPADCGVGVRALIEVGLVELDGSVLRVADAPRTDLTRSAAYRAHASRLEAALAALGGAPPAQVAA